MKKIEVLVELVLIVLIFLAVRGIVEVINFRQAMMTKESQIEATMPHLKKLNKMLNLEERK